MPKQQPAVDEAGTLSVLTLNIWGLWLVSKRRAERVRCVWWPLVIPAHSAVIGVQAPQVTPYGAACVCRQLGSPTYSTLTLPFSPVLSPIPRSHLANYLATCKEDVVLLQEVWVDADAQQLIAAGRAAGLVHATHFRCEAAAAAAVAAAAVELDAHHRQWVLAQGLHHSVSSCQRLPSLTLLWAVGLWGMRAAQPSCAAASGRS